MHWHHINPRHNGGTDDPENLVQVTPEQHAELHLSLYLEHGRWQDYQAALWLSGQNNNKDYLSERNKQNRAKSVSNIINPETNAKRSSTLKRKFAEGTFRPGVSHAPKTEEHNKKNREALKKNWASGTRKEYIPGPASNEGRQKCREAAQRRWAKYRAEKGIE